MPSSRAMAIMLVSLTFLHSQHPNADVAGRWHYWLTAFAVLVPVAPYEILAIFPSNDRIEEMGLDFDRREADRASKEESEELEGLIRLWQRRNILRATMPLAASLVGLWSVVGGLAN